MQRRCDPPMRPAPAIHSPRRRGVLRQGRYRSLFRRPTDQVARQRKRRPVSRQVLGCHRRRGQRKHHGRSRRLRRQQGEAQHVEECEPRLIWHHIEPVTERRHQAGVCPHQGRCRPDICRQPRWNPGSLAIRSVYTWSAECSYGTATVCAWSVVTIRRPRSDRTGRRSCRTCCRRTT